MGSVNVYNIIISPVTRKFWNRRMKEFTHILKQTPKIITFKILEFLFLKYQIHKTIDHCFSKF